MRAVLLPNTKDSNQCENQQYQRRYVSITFKVFSIISVLITVIPQYK